MSRTRKPLVWLVDALTTPPVGREARHEAGTLLRLLQEGEALSFPESRPMPQVSPRVHELRVRDRETRSTWRIFYRIDFDAIVLIEWFMKKTRKTPRAAVDTCRERLRRFDVAAERGAER